MPFAGGQDEAHEPASSGTRGAITRPSTHASDGLCRARGDSRKLHAHAGGRRGHGRGRAGLDRAVHRARAARRMVARWPANARTRTQDPPIPTRSAAWSAVQIWGSYVGKRVAVIAGQLTADRDQTGLGTRGTAGARRVVTTRLRAAIVQVAPRPEGATAAAQRTATRCRVDPDGRGHLHARDGPPMRPPEHVAPASLSPVFLARPGLVGRSARILPRPSSDQIVRCGGAGLDVARRSDVGVPRHVTADPEHFAAPSRSSSLTSRAVSSAITWRTIGVAGHVLDVGIRSRDATVADDVAFPQRVLRLVHSVTPVHSSPVVLGHAEISFRDVVSQGMCRNRGARRRGSRSACPSTLR